MLIQSENLYKMGKLEVFNILVALSDKGLVRSYRMPFGSKFEDSTALNLAQLTFQDAETDDWEIYLLKTDTTLERLNTLCDDVSLKRMITIYVKLINEPVNVWRPVQAAHQKDEIF